MKGGVRPELQPRAPDRRSSILKTLNFTAPVSCFVIFLASDLGVRRSPALLLRVSSLPGCLRVRECDQFVNLRLGHCLPYRWLHVTSFLCRPQGRWGLLVQAVRGRQRACCRYSCTDSGVCRLIPDAVSDAFFVIGHTDFTWPLYAPPPCFYTDESCTTLLVSLAGAQFEAC